ncbi:MAG TPA: cbb3-type cytochrome c oxidase subunit 3 [Devosia sp.]|nr:cbb3-type cytochrome c oxidase subunit 3 [Devosia sp.]
MDYGIFREFADSWGLVYMFAVWFGVLIMLFLPGAKKKANDAAGIPLRDETIVPEDNYNE